RLGRLGRFFTHKGAREKLEDLATRPFEAPSHHECPAILLGAGQKATLMETLVQRLGRDGQGLADVARDTLGCRVRSVRLKVQVFAVEPTDAITFRTPFLGRTETSGRALRPPTPSAWVTGCPTLFIGDVCSPARDGRPKAFEVSPRRVASLLILPLSVRHIAERRPRRLFQRRLLLRGQCASVTRKFEEVAQASGQVRDDSGRATVLPALKRFAPEPGSVSR